MKMDPFSIYEDEFEEFRVRANSGGALPETWKRKRDEARRKRHGDTITWSKDNCFQSEDETIEKLKSSLHKLDIDMGEEDMDLDVEEYFARPHSLPASSRLPRRAERLGMLSHDHRCPHSEHTHRSNEDLYFSVPSRPRSCIETDPFRKEKPVFDFCRVCSFKITPKGIIKGKDQLMIKSEENLAAGSPARHPSPFPNGSSSSLASTGSMVSNGDKVYSVAVLGAVDAGKSSLIRQFLMSEYSDTQAQYVDIDDTAEQRIQVSLDGETTILEIVQNRCPVDYEVGHRDALIVVYSVVDVRSFRTANDILHRIKTGPSRNAPVILVANKTDIVRNRIISHHEGKLLAETYCCKYTEVSVVLRHKMDELLVGIVKQIRLQEGHKQMYRKKQHKDSICCVKGKQSMLVKLLGSRLESKSCDNLLVL